jgi:hypothetical protein
MHDKLICVMLHTRRNSILKKQMQQHYSHECVMHATLRKRIHLKLFLCSFSDTLRYALPSVGLYTLVLTISLTKIGDIFYCRMLANLIYEIKIDSGENLNLKCKLLKLINILICMCTAFYAIFIRFRLKIITKKSSNLIP